MVLSWPCPWSYWTCERCLACHWFWISSSAPVEYQITSLGLAHGIKNDRCKGTKSGHVWYRARWACPSPGSAKDTGGHRGQGVFYRSLLTLSTDWLLILIPKKKKNGRDWLCCFCFEEKINTRGFLFRNSILGTALRRSLVFYYDWAHFIITRQLHTLGWLGLLSLFQPQFLHSLMQLSHEFCYSCLSMGHLGPSLCLDCHLTFTIRSLLPYSGWWDSVSQGRLRADWLVGRAWG